MRVLARWKGQDKTQPDDVEQVYWTRWGEMDLLADYSEEITSADQEEHLLVASLLNVSTVDRITLKRKNGVTAQYKVVPQ